MNRYIKLFANCIPIKGYKQSLIVDLQRGSSSHSIPNSLFDIITQHEDKSIEEIKLLFNHEYDTIIEDYFSFLVKNEFAFECKKTELENFPKLDLTWKSPSIISNAIIDVNILNTEELKKAIAQLSALRCDALQIRFQIAPTREIIKVIGDYLEGTRILSVELIIKYSEENTQSVLVGLANEYPRYQRIFVYSAPNNIMSGCRRIVFDKKDIMPHKDCGEISSQFFSICLETFTESQCYNTCLNRKVSIDKDGYIKNCPSMENHYGHISDTNLCDVVSNPEFKKKWILKKDDIDVCRDCEYRHICTDCRAFVTDPNNNYSKPAKCDYNPFIAKWKGEENWISIEQWRRENPDMSFKSV